MNDATEKTPPTTEKTAAEAVLKTGDHAIRLTFLGITGDGLALCRCDCGTVATFSPVLLGAFVRPSTRRRQKRLPLLRCQACRAFGEKLRAEPRLAG